MDAQREFPAVLALAAELAGVAPCDATISVDRTHRQSERQRAAVERQRQRDADDAERNERAVVIATAEWDAMLRRKLAGEWSLEYRGLEVLIGRSDVVRYSLPGWPSVALHASDGRVINVVTRRFSDADVVPPRIAPQLTWPHVIRRADEPKVRGLTGCPTMGTMVGRLDDITDNTDVILVEGLFDTLTAKAAWPMAVILGAHGAGNLPKIAALAAPLVKRHRGRLLLTVDADAAGERHSEAAGAAALAAGLVLDHDLLIVDIDGHHDLNDAWRAGWRP